MKTPRTIRLVRSPMDDEPGVLRFSEGNKATYYVFHEIPCEIGGRGFAIHRLGLGSLYHVRVGEPEESSCDCLGFLSKGHCKHLHGLAALAGHGVI